jgi:hypothetical protein
VIHAINTNGWQYPIGIQNIFLLGAPVFFCPWLDGEFLVKQLFDMQKSVVAMLEVRFRLAAFKATLSIGDNESGTTQLAIPALQKVNGIPFN